MRHILLIFSIFCASYLPVDAQTNTWTGSGANNDWNTLLNWSQGVSPTKDHTVVIPTGFTVNVNVPTVMKSIILKGGSTLNIADQLSFAGASTFEAKSVVNFSSGTIRGEGVLSNFGTINCTSTASKIIYDNKVIDNAGIINMAGTGGLYITNGILNNLAKGVINLQTEGGHITYSGGSVHQLNNFGLIKRTSAGPVIIYADLHNDGGTLSIEAGELILDSSSTKLTDGTYNVAADASLTWSNIISCEGVLTGSLNGPLNWNGNVYVKDAATFNFSGVMGVYWNSGHLREGGELTNLNKINLATTGVKIIYDNTIFTNKATINIESSGPLYITNGTVNNEKSAIIDLKVDGATITYSGGSVHLLNNSGLIKQNVPSGTTTIHAQLNNNNGTIAVDAGTLIFLTTVKNLTNGVYNVKAGASLQWNSQTVLSGTLTGALAGEIAWNDEVSVPVAANFNFTGNTGVIWNSGSLRTAGELTNLSKITLKSDAAKIIYDNTILTNKGVVNIESVGGLLITNGTVNNEKDAIIDLKVDEASITYSGGSRHVLNNKGLIKQSVTSGTCTIHAQLNNNNGTIAVDGGNLSFLSEAKNLTNGVYNVKKEASLQFNTTINLAGTLTGVLDGALLWTNTVNVPVDSTATFNFTGSTGVNWSDGSLRAGGTLVNKSKITLLSDLNKIIYDGTILNNEGVINYESIGKFLITNGTVNNQKSGLIDLKSDGNDISYSGGSRHILNNYGLIKRSGTDGVSSIAATLNNNGGTITVEKGILDFTYDTKNLTNGIYNTAAGSALSWNSQAVLAGTLTGKLDGDLLWNNEVNVPKDSTATINFTGAKGVKWISGALRGSGTLINLGKIIVANTSNLIIYDETTLNNEGLLSFETTLAFLVTNGVINNQLKGVIDFLVDEGNISYSGGSMHILNNYGLIKKSAGTGSNSFFTDTINYGIIDAQVGTLSFEGNYLLNNTVDGIIKGNANINIPVANKFTNDGTFAPGGTPGTLSVVGNYKSSSSSVLDIDLFGLTSGKEHDVLDITGNADLEGSVNVNMNFAAKIKDEFIIAKTSGTISKCALSPTATAEFDGKIYAFNVKCAKGNEVVLTLNTVTLGIEDYDLAANVILYPNPVRNQLTIKNNGNLELHSANIMDITGKNMGTINLLQMGVSKNISVENFTTGVYFVKVQGANGSFTKRIIKE